MERGALLSRLSVGCDSEQGVQEVVMLLNQQHGCMHICLGTVAPPLQTWQGCCKTIGRDWQSQKVAKDFEKVKQNASPFFVPLITSTITKFIPMLSLGLYLFQAMHVTVNNYGCSRNKSCGHIGSAMK